MSGRSQPSGGTGGLSGIDAGVGVGVRFGTLGTDGTDGTVGVFLTEPGSGRQPSESSGTIMGWLTDPPSPDSTTSANHPPISHHHLWQTSAPTHSWLICKKT